MTGPAFPFTARHRLAATLLKRLWLMTACCRWRRGWLTVSCWFVVLGSPAVFSAENPPPEQVALETSDRVSLNMSFYPAGEAPTATVILVHDIGGSPASVQDLARGLQQAGCAVAVPELRGHAGATERISATLKPQDMNMIAASGGGAIRQTAMVKGDLETVRNWLKAREADGDVDLERLCVIGSGLGGTLASLWTAADWSWRPNTQGPQGQDVKAVVLISPEWAGKGVSLTTALAARAFVERRPTQPLLEHLPLLIIAGRGDAASDRLFKRLQAARPQSWYTIRPDGSKTQADRKGDGTPPAGIGPVVYAQINTSLRADKLATLPGSGTTPLALSLWFIKQSIE